MHVIYDSSLSSSIFDQQSTTLPCLSKRRNRLPPVATIPWKTPCKIRKHDIFRLKPNKQNLVYFDPNQPKSSKDEPLSSMAMWDFTHLWKAYRSFHRLEPEALYRHGYHHRSRCGHIHLNYMLYWLCWISQYRSNFWSKKLLWRYRFLSLSLWLSDLNHRHHTKVSVSFR